MLAPSQIRGFLIDLDGTVFSGETLIPGAAATLQALDRRGLPFRLVTNTTSKPLSAILAKIHAAGLSVPSTSVFSAPVIAREYLLAHDLKRCFPLLNRSLLEDLEGIEFVENAPQAVLVGDVRDDLSYAALNRAFRFLLEGAAFITLARNRTFRGADGLYLDVGAIVAALEYASERPATLIGKPSPDFFSPALRSMGLAPENAVMIGDDLEADVAGAQAAGIAGVLVRTGKFRPEQLVHTPVVPDAILESLADLPSLLGEE